MGATQLVWAVRSLRRAWGIFATNTVADPLEIMPGPPGTHPGNMQGADVSVARDAGILPISTVASPLIIARGRPG